MIELEYVRKKLQSPLDEKYRVYEIKEIKIELTVKTIIICNGKGKKQLIFKVDETFRSNSSGKKKYICLVSCSVETKKIE